MPILTDNPTIKEMQLYIKQFCLERKWDNVTHLEKFLLFSEEVGELAKAIRYHTKLGLEQNKIDKTNLADEFADVLNFLLDLANHFDVDLETAFREKNKKNETRVWS
jgi:NTP pyrophosphatase (non-canonical NTP hydrolase)